MTVSYKRLWKFPIGKEMKKGEFSKAAASSTASVTKMGKYGYVTIEILDKICTALECRGEDVMEIMPNINE